MSTSSSARDEALIDVARRRGLVRADRLEHVLAQSRGSSLGQSLARGLSQDELSAIEQVARCSRYVCGRGCVKLGFAELESLPRLACPRCGAALVSQDAARHPSSGGGLVQPARASGPTARVAGEPREVGGYDVLATLGRGSFGVVYLVRRPGLERQFALKVLLDAQADEELLARFRLEGAVAAKLEHPGIVGVVDVGVHGEVPFLVMEYCAGPTLRQRLREVGRLPPGDAARLVAELARAMAYAHERGVLHRDLKPANVILEAHTGRPRITDFGLARDRSLARSMTRTGDVVGTPSYAAPEQLRGEKDVDARIDVWALGVMLYECLTGERPFAGPDVVSLAREVLGGRLRPPRELAPDVPAALEGACLHALERDRSLRTPGARALAEELEAALGEPGPSPTAAAAPRARPRSRPVMLATGGAVAAVLLAGGITIGRAARDDPPPETLATTPPPTTTPAPSPTSTTPSPPPTTPAPPSPPARAPDAEVEPLLRAAEEAIRVNEQRSVDEVAVALLTADGAPLARRFPDDPRVGYVASLGSLLRGEDDLEARRGLVRALLAAPLDDVLKDRAARVSKALGFERAAADLLEPAFAGGRTPDAACCLCLLQIYMKSAPPVRDTARAASIARLALAARAEDPRDGDALQPPTWDLWANLGELLLFDGDLEGASRAYRGAADSSRNGRARDFFAGRAAEIERGARGAGYDVPGREVAHHFPLTPLMRQLANAWHAADQRREREVAAKLATAAERDREAGRPAHAALDLVAAARMLERVGQTDGAIDLLEAAAALELPARDADVRALVLRTLARLLRDGEPARAEALALAAARMPADVPLTPGERADAWVVVGLARRARGDGPGAAQAAAEAANLRPFDIRGIEALRR